MTDIHLKLTVDEKAFLLRLLESTLGDERVEERRTDRPAYKELVRQEISLTENLLEKVKTAGI